MTAPIPRDIPELRAIPGVPAPSQSVVPASAVVTPTRRPFTAAFRLTVALAAAAGVVIELSLDSPLHVLSYFAIQTGVLVTVVFTISASRAWTARHPLPPLVTGGTLLYVLIAALIHHVLLTRGSTVFLMAGEATGTATATPTGKITTLAARQTPATPLLHTALPLALITDWLFLTRPAPLRPAHAAAWLLYPMAYLTFTLTCGALLPHGSSAPYLYPFLDVTHHGYQSVLTNTFLLGLACYALALLLVALDHLRPYPIRHRHDRLDW